MPKILLIDDEPDVRHVTRECLSTKGFEVDIPAVEDSAISRSTVQAATTDGYDLIILDLRLPHLDPFDLIRSVNESEGPPIMVLAGFLSLELESSLRAAGVHSFTTKPFTFSDLLSSVEECMASSVAVRI